MLQRGLDDHCEVRALTAWSPHAGDGSMSQPETLLSRLGDRKLLVTRLRHAYANSLAANSTKSFTMISGWYSESSVGSLYRLT